ncbi:oligosaccharide flippase family protein [Marinivivus vitaminiproducens]|uniref:oligosaccharide flippase family protein n=1 Tax=Marinivivus vitaminiproducens TaxID=3035935 RepID=UPI0027980E0F|nr:oligosaccharide flippase family protein [Geminicoccaceae bacterium SCSIO 64248]
MVKSAVFFSFVQRYGEQVIKLVALAVLSRLLTAEEFGVFAAAYAIATMAESVGQFGVPTYLAQAAAIGPRERRAAFSLTLCASGLGVVAMLVAGQVWAGLGSDGRIGDTILLLAVWVGLGPLVTTWTGLLQRELAFRRLCTVGVLMSLARAACSIALALAGFGLASLALGEIAGRLAQLALLGRSGAARRDDVRFSWAAMREAFVYCAKRAGIALVTAGGNAAPALAAGTLLSFAAAGTYSRAQRVAGLFEIGFTQALQPVVQPALSRLRRRGGDMKAAYLTKSAILTGVGWPFLGLLALMAAPLSAILLGPGWDDAVPVIQLLCLVGATRALVLMNSEFYIATDMLDRLLRQQTVLLGFKIVAIFAFALVSLEAMILSMTLPTLAVYVMAHRNLGRALGFTKREALGGLGRSALVTALCLVPGGLMLREVQALDLPALLQIGLIATAGGLGWLLGVFLSGHPLAGEFKSAGRLAMARVHTLL